jgi:hypothetical protein
VRRRVAVLVLLSAVGSCELPKPPIPHIPAGDVGPGSGQAAAVWHAPARDAGPGWGRALPQEADSGQITLARLGPTR